MTLLGESAVTRLRDLPLCGGNECPLNLLHFKISETNAHPPWQATDVSGCPG